MVDRQPRVAEPVEADDYLALLDRALLDRHLSASEQDALVDVARELGLSRAVAMDLHRTYLEALADAAWQDGVVTPDERTDLGHVADLLGLAGPDVDSALAAAETASGGTSRWGRFQLRPGSLVVFTGQTTRPRDEWEAGATAAGLVVRGSISKKVDLVIAADPDSMSGKAATARRYGIPIVTEGAFGTLLKGMAGRP
jgi:DNA polymerase-3 subunit epsilon